MKPIPPQYSIAPSWLLYSQDLPKPVLVTALRIYGLGWRHRYQYSDPITIDELCRVLGLERTQVYEHLAQLGGVLRYDTIAGTMRFQFSGDACPPASSPTHIELTEGQRLSPENRTDDPPSPENRTAVLHVVVSSDKPTSVGLREQQHVIGESGKPDSDGVPEETGVPLDDELVALLGLVLAPEVAQRLVREYSEEGRIEEQFAHYCWAKRNGRAVGPGFLVRAIEADWWIPAEAQRWWAHADLSQGLVAWAEQVI